MDPNTILDSLYALVLAIWAMPQVQVITLHVCFNFVLAVAVALATYQFRFDKLWEVFGRKLLPLVMVYAAVRVIGSVLADAQPGTFTAFMQLIGTIGPPAALLAIEALLFSDMIDNLGRIPGLEKLVDAVPRPFANMLFGEMTLSILETRRLESGRGEKPSGY